MKRRNNVGKITKKEQRLAELRARRAICQAAIKLVERETDDPRRESALKEYQRQLAEIDRLITVITGTPPPVVIGLRAATLSGKS